MTATSDNAPKTTCSGFNRSGTPCRNRPAEGMETCTYHAPPGTVVTKKHQVMCKARSRRTLEPCQRPAIPGGTVCRYHGGNSPAAREKALKRLAVIEIDKAARKAVAFQGLEPVEDPMEALSKHAQSLMATSEALGAMVNNLEEVAGFSTTELGNEVPYIHGLMELFTRSQDKVSNVLATLVKLGYAERKVAVEEQQALIISGIIRRVINAIGLTDDQQRRANAIMAAEFRALSVPKD